MLQDAYARTIANLDSYFSDCQQAYDDRRNYWQGKSKDFRKNWQGAFPWVGASDQEANVIGERIDSYVGLSLRALDRSHIKAFPTKVAGLPAASLVSSFLKYCRQSYIPNFRDQMELAANHLFEKKLAITYVGWFSNERTVQQRMSLQEIAEMSPDLAEAFADEDNEDGLVGMLQQTFPKLKEKRARRAVKELRETGEAVLTVSQRSLSRPEVSSCTPDGDVFFPDYTVDPQRAPYCFRRTWMTPQEIEQKVATEGWDREWADHVIENLRGQDSFKIDAEKSPIQFRSTQPVTEDNDLIMVVYGYQRLIDPDDGSEGIYCTVFHPKTSEADGPQHAKFELLNGFDDYPFVVTRLSADQKRLYEGQNVTDNLRGPQWQIKTEVDSRADRNSLATCPPLMHPAGRPPSDWGPARRVPYRRLGEFAFGPVPPFDAGGSEMLAQMRAQADRAVGLDFEHPTSVARQDFYIQKFLGHVRDVLKMAWKLYGKMGDDEVFFQVTGSPDPLTMTRDIAGEDYNIMVNFDTMANDPETAEGKVKQIGSLIQFDRNGRISIDRMLEFAAQAIDPTFADYVLMSQEESADKVTKAVTDDLAKIFSGIEVPAQPSGAQVALQLVQAYAQQEDIAARLQNDEAFAERLQKYAGQYSFQLQQAQNAQIGKIGTAPAAVGGVQTQGMEQ